MRQACSGQFLRRLVLTHAINRCNPCHKLNPMLLEEAQKNEGKWKLALVDVEIEEL